MCHVQSRFAEKVNRYLDRVGRTLDMRYDRRAGDVAGILPPEEKYYVE